MGDRNLETVILQDSFGRIQKAVLRLEGQEFPIFKGINLIGRKALINVVLPKPTISSNHACIVVVDDKTHFISDLGSANGTFLNTKLKPNHLYELQDGAEVKFADINMQYKKLPEVMSNVRVEEQNIGLKNASQVFGAATQLLNDSLDIHNEPTQVLFDKNTVSNEKSHCEIHTAPTQVMLDDTEIDDSFGSKQSNNVGEVIDSSVVSVENQNESSNDSLDFLEGLPSQHKALFLNAGGSQQDQICNSTEIEPNRNESDLEGAESQLKTNLLKKRRSNVLSFDDTQVSLSDRSKTVNSDSDTDIEDIIPATQAFSPTRTNRSKGESGTVGLEEENVPKANVEVNVEERIFLESTKIVPEPNETEKVFSAVTQVCMDQNLDTSKVQRTEISGNVEEIDDVFMKPTQFIDPNFEKGLNGETSEMEENIPDVFLEPTQKIQFESKNQNIEEDIPNQIRSCEQDNSSKDKTETDQSNSKIELEKVNSVSNSESNESEQNQNNENISNQTEAVKDNSLRKRKKFNSLNNAENTSELEKQETIKKRKTRLTMNKEQIPSVDDKFNEKSSLELSANNTLELKNVLDHVNTDQVQTRSSRRKSGRTGNRSEDTTEKLKIKRKSKRSFNDNDQGILDQKQLKESLASVSEEEQKKPSTELSSKDGSKNGNSDSETDIEDFDPQTATSTKTVNRTNLSSEDSIRLGLSEENVSKANLESSIEERIFLESTKIVPEPNETEKVFSAVTQIYMDRNLDTSKLQHTEVSGNIEEIDDVFMKPTQFIDLNFVKDLNGESSEMVENVLDIFLEPTQKIQFESKDQNVEEDIPNQISPSKQDNSTKDKTEPDQTVSKIELEKANSEQNSVSNSESNESEQNQNNENISNETEIVKGKSLRKRKKVNSLSNGENVTELEKQETSKKRKTRLTMNKEQNLSVDDRFNEKSSLELSANNTPELKVVLDHVNTDQVQTRSSRRKSGRTGNGSEEKTEGLKNKRKSKKSFNDNDQEILNQKQPKESLASVSEEQQKKPNTELSSKDGPKSVNSDSETDIEDFVAEPQTATSNKTVNRTNLSSEDSIRLGWSEENVSKANLESSIEERIFLEATKIVPEPNETEKVYSAVTQVCVDQNLDTSKVQHTEISGNVEEIDDVFTKPTQFIDPSFEKGLNGESSEMGENIPDVFLEPTQKIQFESKDQNIEEGIPNQISSSEQENGKDKTEPDQSLSKIELEKANSVSNSESNESEQNQNNENISNQIEAVKGNGLRKRKHLNSLNNAENTSELEKQKTVNRRKTRSTVNKEQIPSVDDQLHEKSSLELSANNTPELKVVLDHVNIDQIKTRTSKRNAGKDKKEAEKSKETKSKRKGKRIIDDIDESINLEPRTAEEPIAPVSDEKLKSPKKHNAELSKSKITKTRKVRENEFGKLDLTLPKKRRPNDTLNSTVLSESEVNTSTPKNRGRPKKNISVINSPLSSVSKEVKKIKSEVLESPNRSQRAIKPKVVFTMMDDSTLESAVRSLGGQIVDSVDKCTVLVTSSIKRSQKLLSAIGQNKPICGPDWLKQSKSSNRFLDPQDFILQDPEGEKKWNFSLRESIERGAKKLLKGFTFMITTSVAVDVLKGAIESCGGKTVTRVPSNLENFYIIGDELSRTKFEKVLKKHPKISILEPEAIFEGVLRQEMRFEKYFIK